MENARQFGKVVQLKLPISVRLVFKMLCYLAIRAPILNEH